MFRLMQAFFRSLSNKELASEEGHNPMGWVSKDQKIKKSFAEPHKNQSKTVIQTVQFSRI